MNNIFTFEQQDEEQFENKQNIQSIHASEQTVTTLAQSHKTKEETLNFNNRNQFEFEDFEQEQIKKEHRMPLQTIQDSTTNFKTQKIAKEENNQIFEMKKNVRRLKKNSNSTPLSGLQVEDLGIKQMQYVSEKKALKVTDMRKFLHTPLGEYKVKAIIRKEEGNLFSFNNKFNVYIQQNNRYLFTISREGLTEYNFSLQKNNYSQKKKSFLGKMFSNMVGTQFLLFDNGFSPKETRQLQCCRKQLASIKYETSSGPRKFTAIVSTNCQGFYSLDPEKNILQEKWQKKQRDYLSILYSKTPQLDPEDGNYKLDFKGIVKKASVKNFILGGKQWNDSLIFGKIDKDTFIMEIKQPLGVLQAAAICVSSIHYKFHWK